MRTSLEKDQRVSTYNLLSTTYEFSRINKLGRHLPTTNLTYNTVLH